MRGMGVWLAVALVAGCGDGGVGGSEGGSAHFRLVNRGHTSLYLQASPGPFWGLSRGGQSLRAVDACAVCNCTDTACVTCGPAAATGKLTLAPGASHSWTWD